MPKNKNSRILIGGTAIIIALFFVISIFSHKTVEITNPKSEEGTSTLQALRVPRAGLFSSADIIGKDAYVYDLTNNQVIFNKNAFAALPLASITKLMTALVSSEILTDDQTVTVQSSSLSVEGESGLVANEQWKFKDLRDFTLMVSSNDGANALALAAGAKLSSSGTSSPVVYDPEVWQKSFVIAMNDRAASLGLNSFHFENESGLDVSSTTAGGMGSAEDVAKLLQYMIKKRPDILEITKYHNFRFTSLNGTVHYATNTDLDITKISRIIASKTGYTALAGGNLAVAYDPAINHSIVIVVLGSTVDGRFSDVMKLASSTLAYLQGR